MGWARRRRYGNPDRNQQPIVDLVRALPASAENLTGVGGGCPDLLVGFRGHTVLAEVKQPGGKLRPSQEDFRQRWHGGPILLVEDGMTFVQQLIALDAAHPPKQAAERRLRALFSNQGGCRVLSKGFPCGCPLCDLDIMAGRTHL
jgi:hypothetical protein